MADISSQINSLPQDLREAIDNLYAGDLIECLHCILRYSAVANEEALKLAVCRRDLLNLEAQYDSMHLEMSRQTYELKSALEASNQRQFDMQYYLELNATDKQGAAQYIRQLKVDVEDFTSKHYAYQTALLKANDELTKLQRTASELATENARLKDLMAQQQAQLAASALYCSSLEKAKDRAEEQQEPEMERSARVYRAGNVQVMPKTRYEDGIIRVQTCDAETQVGVENAVKCAQTDLAEDVPADPYKRPQKLGLMRAPSLYSDMQKNHVISLLQEQNFDLRNLLVYQYATNQDDKVKAFMLMDKLDAVSFLLTQNENLAGALAAYQLLNTEFADTAHTAYHVAEELDLPSGPAPASSSEGNLALTAVHNTEEAGNRNSAANVYYLNVGDSRKQLEIALQQNAMLQRRLGILKQLKSAPSAYVETLFYKTLAEIYEGVFLQGVRVHVAHLLAGGASMEHPGDYTRSKDTFFDSASLESGVLAALKKFDMRGGDPQEKLNGVLSLLLRVARNPANQPFLNEQLSYARREIAALYERARRQNSVLRELYDFTRFLGSQIEQKITHLQSLAESFPGAQKARKLQQIAAEQNEIIMQLRAALEALKDKKAGESAELVDFACQAGVESDSESIIMQQSQQLQDLYGELAEKVKINTDLAARLQALVNKAHADSQDFRAAVKTIAATAADTQRAAAEMVMNTTLKCASLETAKTQLYSADGAIFSIQSKVRELQMKYELGQSILNQINGVVRVQQSAQTECAVLVDREVQDYDILEVQSAQQQTDPPTEAFDFAYQHDSVCANCEMARDVYDAIKVQNSQLTAQTQLARQQIKEVKAQCSELQSEVQLARQKATSFAAQLKQQVKMTAREKIEARQHRKRAMELAAANQQLSGENKVLAQKTDYLSGQAATSAKGREQMKIELQALSAAYSGAVDQLKTVKDKLDVLYKRASYLESEVTRGRTDSKEAAAACTEFKQRLEKALLDVEKWRQKYLYQRKATPKRELDTDKQSTLESILSTDDIQSIYEW